MQWQVNLFDAGGSLEGRDRAMAEALASAPVDLILVGTDAKIMAPRLRPFAALGVPKVGWHVGSKAGPMVDNPAAMNITTAPLAVARIAASAVAVASRGQTGTFQTATVAEPLNVYGCS